MFKKVLQSISHSVQRQADSPAESGKAAAKPAPNAAIMKLVAAPPPMAMPVQEVTPEDLCGINAKMSKEQIYSRLKLLYRRYNHAAASLDGATRSEAEVMLNAIVTVREKVYGPL